MQKEQHRHPLIAGALAGAAEISCTYPLEYAKTQVQLGTFRNTRECFRYAWFNGIRTLYRGLQSNLAFAFPRTAIRFGVYEAVAARWRRQQQLEGGGALLSSGQMFLAGAAAGLVEGAVVIVPMTTLQVRLIADLNRPGGRQFSGLVHMTRVILHAEGVRGLYRGAMPTVGKIVFNVAFRFVLYDEFVRALDAALPLPQAGSSGGGAGGGGLSWHADVTSVAAGGLAGALTVLANHPIDVVKSHMQAGTLPGGGGSLACWRWLVSTGGYGALYRGLVPRLNRVVAETGLTMAFYRRFSALCNDVLDGPEP